MRGVLRLRADGMFKRQIAASLSIGSGRNTATVVCEVYRAWEGRMSPTMRQSHVAGEQMFVWTMPARRWR
jgi:hypothetical protein